MPLPENATKSDKSVDPGFAPRDFTDGRRPWDWRSKWDSRAWWFMAAEATWVAFLLALGAMGVLRESKLVPRVVFTYEHFIWTGGAAGLLGGTAYGIKWFYHSIAKGLWHSDRRWWRLFAAPLSAVVGVIVTLVTLHGDIAKAIVAPIEDVAVRGDLFVNTLIHGFLGGYFSDRAIAVLQNIAGRVFGGGEPASSEEKPRALAAPSPPRQKELVVADGEGSQAHADKGEQQGDGISPKPGAVERDKS